MSSVVRSSKWSSITLGNEWSTMDYWSSVDYWGSVNVWGSIAFVDWGCLDKKLNKNN